MLGREHGVGYASEEREGAVSAESERWGVEVEGDANLLVDWIQRGFVDQGGYLGPEWGTVSVAEVVHIISLQLAIRKKRLLDFLAVDCLIRRSPSEVVRQFVGREVST